MKIINLMVFLILTASCACSQDIGADIGRKLSDILITGNIPDSLTIRYSYDEGGVPIESLMREELTINGNGKTVYYNNVFIDKSNWFFDKYEYNTEKEVILEIINEIQRSNFVSRKFAEERTQDDMPNECTTRSFSVSIDGESITKVFLEKLSHKEEQEILNLPVNNEYDKGYASYMKRYIGKGIPTELERFQFLLDEVMRNRRKFPYHLTLAH